MKCGRVTEILGFYVDAVLSEREMGEVADHLVNCEACRAELAALTAMIEAARGIEEIEPPIDLRASIAAATTLKPVAERSLLARLRPLLAPPTVRWAVGFVGAAAVVVAALVTTLTPELPSPQIARKHSGAPVPAALAPTPVAPSMAMSAPVATPKKPPFARRIHPSRVAHTMIAQRAVPSSVPSGPVHKAAAAKSVTPVADQDNANVYGVDDTTVARTITPADIHAPEPVAAESNPKVERVSVKVASSPLPKDDQVAEWVKDAKTAASMHSRGAQSGLSLINARF